MSIIRHTLKITPQQFIDSCTEMELREVLLLADYRICHLNQQSAAAPRKTSFAEQYEQHKPLRPQASKRSKSPKP
jgi:hypothetical protein